MRFKTKFFAPGKLWEMYGSMKRNKTPHTPAKVKISTDGDEVKSWMDLNRRRLVRQDGVIIL